MTTGIIVLGSPLGWIGNPKLILPIKDAQQALEKYRKTCDGKALPVTVTGVANEETSLAIIDFFLANRLDEEPEDLTLDKIGAWDAATWRKVTDLVNARIAACQPSNGAGKFPTKTALIIGGVAIGALGLYLVTR